jgi:signal transduction histidine kinase
MAGFFAKIGKRIGGFINYASQIRLVILLLFLFLVLLNLQTTYLFEQTRKRLDQELESRLNLAAFMVYEHERWHEAAGRGGNKGERILRDESSSWLKTWVGQFGLERVLIMDRRGKSLAIDASGRTTLLNGPFPAGVRSTILERAWRGETVSTPIYRDPSQDFHKALFVPLRGSEGEIVGLIGVVAPATFLGNISRISSFIFYGFLVGIPAALVISLYFISFVLRPYRRLSLATPYVTAEETSPDVDTIVSTYERTIQALREKETEMASLYQTEQKRAHDLENYQNYLLSSISSGVLSLDPGYRIQVCNEVARGILRLPELRIQGNDAREVFAAMPELQPLLAETLEQGKIHKRREFEIEREENEKSWVGLSSSLLKDETGALEGAIFLLTDLTEIRRLQEQMRISENLAALGEMSAGVAHEFRNSLSTLLGQCRLLQRRLPDGSSGQKTLQEMIAEIVTLEGVIREFLRFARPQDLKIQPLDLGDFLRELETSFAETLAESHIRMRITPCPEVVVRADPLALRQALVNLIQNSQEAMPQGGEITMSVTLPRSVRAWARGKFPSSDRRFLRISISDNGRGMDEKEKQKAFLPFFTTKEKGTGLGLALVQKAIVGMGGKIELESELGSGTTFHLDLPLPAPEEGEEGKARG